ncbi:sulfate transporter, partial [Mycobacterium sp. ITM-2017-0098]
MLDSRTYRTVRDRVIKAALDQPDSVIVDVTALSAPAESAWAVFTSARWHLTTWPEVPIALVCEHADGRRVLARNGITRYVGVYDWVATATSATRTAPRARRRVR